MSEKKKSIFQAVLQAEDVIISGPEFDGIREKLMPIGNPEVLSNPSIIERAKYLVYFPNDAEIVSTSQLENQKALLSKTVKENRKAQKELQKAQEYNRKAQEEIQKKHEEYKKEQENWNMEFEWVNHL